VNAIVPADKHVFIEFEDADHLAIFELEANGKFTIGRDINTHSEKTDSLLNVLGWTQQTLSTLKRRLDKANCISIRNGTPCQIGFRRSRMGMYFYAVFDKAMADSVKEDYNDSCRYILHNEKVALEYGGGAIGPQCFEDHDR